MLVVATLILCCCLLQAEVAFIDEIFKANSAILNTLLTLINERLFDNGSQRTAVPLLTMVGASNELPESEELDALYDRFLVGGVARCHQCAGNSIYCVNAGTLAFCLSGLVNRQQGGMTCAVTTWLCLRLYILPLS